MSQFVYDFISTIFNLYLIVIFDSKLQFDVVNCLSYDCELFECPGHVNKYLYLVNIWPSPKNCHLNVKKLPKEHIFFKNCPKLSFFSKKLRMAFFFFKWQFFTIKKNIFLAIFWHSNGNFPEGHVSICWTSWTKVEKRKCSISDFYIWAIWWKHLYIHLK